MDQHWKLEDPHQIRSQHELYGISTRYFSFIGFNAHVEQQPSFRRSQKTNCAVQPDCSSSRILMPVVAPGHRVRSSFVFYQIFFFLCWPSRGQRNGDPEQKPCSTKSWLLRCFRGAGMLLLDCPGFDKGSHGIP